MSVLNGLAYLEEAVESIRAQTIHDWQLVAVDNGSTDGTSDYLMRLAHEDDRITYMHLAAPLSHSAGLNAGLDSCRGDWIARIDADDRALPQRLERQLAYVEANPDIDVLGCLAYYIDHAGRRVAKTSHDLTTREVFARYQSTNEAIGILHPGALIRRDTLVSLGGYRPEFDPANDIDLWARVVDAGGLVLVQPEYLMEYRVHTASQVARKFELAHLKYQWSRASSAARREGRPEPTWSEFQAAWSAQPARVRANRWRKRRAKQLYREAALDWIGGRRVRAVVRLAYGTALQPRYTLRRARAQWL
jgi:glycosyltransferase involved in cell wall biosynthesis